MPCHPYPMAYRRAEQRTSARRSRSGPAPEGGSRQAWTRVARSRADAVADRLSGPVAGAFAAGWSAILTLLMVGALIVVAWVLGAGTGSITDAMHISGISWLATHLIPISVPDGSISALPMGFVIIPGWLLWRAGNGPPAAVVRACGKTFARWSESARASTQRSRYSSHHGPLATPSRSIR